MTEIELVKKAMEARTRAYVPYSHHSVGAALECTDGTIFLGCNVENAGYSSTNCAERTAIFKAVSEGHLKYNRIAVVGGMEDLQTIDFCAPCGVCRQVMMEFVNPKTFEIILARVDNAINLDLIEEKDIIIKKYTLEEILPLGFGPSNLGVEN